MSQNARIIAIAALTLFAFANSPVLLAAQTVDPGEPPEMDLPMDEPAAPSGPAVPTASQRTMHQVANPAETDPQSSAEAEAPPSASQRAMQMQQRMVPRISTESKPSEPATGDDAE